MTLGPCGPWPNALEKAPLALPAGLSSCWARAPEPCMAEFLRARCNRLPAVTSSFEKKKSRVYQMDLGYVIAAVVIVLSLAMLVGLAAEPSGDLAQGWLD